MFKVIELNPENINCVYKNNIIKLQDLSHSTIISEKDKFSRTMASEFGNKYLDFMKKYSWTHKETFSIPTPNEAINFFLQFGIKTGTVNDSYELIKYDKGSFSAKEYIRSKSQTHKYMCMIFCPFEDSNENPNYKGGRVQITHPRKLFSIEFNMETQAKNNKWVMIIFSTSLYCEVSTIISGTRWVFIKPLEITDDKILTQTNKSQSVTPSKVDILADGSFHRVRKTKANLFD